MGEMTEYKRWCESNGYKPSNAKALAKYYNELKIKKERFIRSKMSLHGDTVESLAEFIGIARQTLSRKIYSEAKFTLAELILIKQHYNLTDEEFIELCTQEVAEDEYTRGSEAVK